MPTVHEVTLSLLRRLGLTTIVGNPGSTEEPFLNDLPDDFTYVLALHEASAVGIADGLSQATGAPVLVNLHTNAGLGNAMGNIVTARCAKTPLIITAGQQTREMLAHEPFLTNIDAETLPKPWVKWSHEPRRPQDVPAAFMRAYITAMQPPRGPVFLSLPMDDWNAPMEDVDVYRPASDRVAPDPERLAAFARALGASANPALVYGGDVARSGAFELGIAFAEKCGAPVFLTPLPERIPFPQDHPQYAGILPPSIAPLRKRLEGHDLVLVVGAPVFRYYPWSPGAHLPDGTRLLHVTDDLDEAAKAVAGESLAGDAGLTLAALAEAVSQRDRIMDATLASVTLASVTTASAPPLLEQSASGAPAAGDGVMTAKALFEALSEALPQDEVVVVNESPSNMAEFFQTKIGRITRPDGYYLTASGGLGWAMPAAVGLAMAEKRSGRARPVIVLSGDGSFQFSPQALWTAVRQGVHLVCVVLRNREYAILKGFAKMEKLANVPGLDLPGIDCVSLARGWGAWAVRAQTPVEAGAAFAKALAGGGVTVIEVPVAGQGG